MPDLAQAEPYLGAALSGVAVAAVELSDLLAAVGSLDFDECTDGRSALAPMGCPSWTWMEVGAAPPFSVASVGSSRYRPMNLLPEACS